MISTIKKNPVQRYALIISLIIILFISAFYLYLYYSRAVRLRYNVNEMVVARESAAKIDSCLVYLYSADNSSRLYALTADHKYFRQFSSEIKFVNAAVQQLNAKNKTAVRTGKLNELIGQKAVQTENYIRLKLLSDSLLKSVSRINDLIEERKEEPVKAPVIRKTVSEIKIDTIRPVITVKTEKKKKFFGRLFDAFSAKQNKAQEPSVSPTIVRKRIDKVVEITTIVPRAMNSYGKDYRKLFVASDKLKNNEQELLKINNQLIVQIINSLKNYKVAEQHSINKRKGELNNNLQDAVLRFKKLSGIILVFLILLVVIVLYNIWKIFRHEKELMMHSDRAEQETRSKSAFLATMSHEIRTPLNSVIGFSEQLSQTELDESQQEHVNAISSSSKMLLEVVNEILDFSKFETGKMSFDLSPFKPCDAIEEIFNSVTIQAENKGLLLIKELDLDPDTCLNGDYFRLKQVILNFLGNAVKFTEKGSILLKASLVKLDDEKRILHVSVKDTGIGIARENIDAIFGEFSQVGSAQKRASQKGTGLGLAISKKIIELQGGTILVSSEPGKGSEFSFQLPFELAGDPGCVEDDPVADQSAYQYLDGKHILVADDHRLNLLLLTTILKKWKITYDTAIDGKEAAELFDANDYDLLLTDIEMPEMDGIELSAYVRQRADMEKAGIPILALTANVLKEDTDRYLAAGMDGVVLKPFSEKQLLDNLTAALKKTRLLDECSGGG